MADKEIEFHSFTSCQDETWKKILAIKNFNKVGNAYIFSGPRGSGKEGIAIKFAQLLNCEANTKDSCQVCPSCMRCEKLEHESIKYIFPLPTSSKNTSNNLSEISTKDAEYVKSAFSKKSKNLFHKIRIPKANKILLQSVRQLKKFLYLTAHSNGRKVVIVFDAHLMSTGQAETANAFLKLLEEPPSKTTFVLVTDYPDHLLATIVSRSQKINFPKLSDSYIRSWLIEEGVDSKSLNLFSAISRGNMQSAEFFVDYNEKDIIKLISDLVSKTTKKNPVNWRSFVDEYSRIAIQNKTKFVYHFMMLKVWLLSANLLKKGIDHPLQNTSLKTSMEKFILDHPSSDLSKFIVELEKAENSISLNLNMSLVLVNMLINIQEILKD
tara:strand:- start:793 stop:1935 length:1143 start_codon:yes stop_codon:yes gene_type:complete